MLQHYLAGLVGLAFTRWLDRRVQPRAQRARRAVWIAIAFALAPLNASADSIADGVKVRIRSSSIEAGWHTGTIKRDDRRCAMVQLDHPTQHGYTLLALMVVDALQLGRIGQWTAISPTHAIASEPAHCLAEGSD